MISSNLAMKTEILRLNLSFWKIITMMTKKLGNKYQIFETILLNLMFISKFLYISCKYISGFRKTGRAMQERIKEYDRDIRFARTQNSAVSNE